MSVDQTHVRESNVEETDEGTIHYFVTSEQGDWPIHLLVMEVLAEVADRPTNELEPLHHAVDPEALNHLFQSRPTGHARSEGKVTFPVDEYQVTITAHESIVVTEGEPTR